jgi:hypothetical protein
MFPLDFPLGQLELYPTPGTCSILSADAGRRYSRPGAPSAHRRQAGQFNGSRQVIGRAGGEIDIMAELLPSCRRG